ncbi:type II secretion system F family protein [Stygiolobus sp. RP850M]|uniref:type II secretion system F family protein n=1 Tax=Stygiolobus sp. RP850M TaxID=3133137 RepID=UPI00307F82DD
MRLGELSKKSKKTTMKVKPRKEKKQLRFEASPINFLFTLIVTIDVLTLTLLSFKFLRFSGLPYLESLLLGLLLYSVVITVFNYIHKYDDYLTDIIVPLVEKSKLIEDPNIWLKEMVQYSWYGYLLSAVVGMMIYIVSGAVLYSLAGGAVVIITYFYPWVKMWDARNSLATQVEKEMPIVSIVMWSMAQLGYGIMKMVEELKSSETYADMKIKSRDKKTRGSLLIFDKKSSKQVNEEEKLGTEYLKAVPREFLKIHRDFVIFNMPPEEAIAREAMDHPSKVFERLLLGAVSISKSGGSLMEFMNRITVEVMEELKRKWENFGRAASNLGELALLFLLIVPLFSISFAVSSNNPVYGTDSIAFFMVPLIGFALYMYLALSAPPEDVKINGDIKKGGIALAISMILLAVLTILKILSPRGLLLWIYFEMPMMAFSFFYGYSAYQRIKAKNEAEEKLPIFVRSVAELIRSTGDNFFNALRKLQEGDLLSSTLVKATTFGKLIDDTISRYVSSMITTGNFNPRTDSWILNTVFRNLMEMDRQGVLRYNIFTRLAEITDAYYDAIMAKKRSLYMFVGAAAIAPAIMAGVIVMTVYVLHNISGIAQIPNLNLEGVNGIAIPSGITGLLNFFTAFINIGNEVNEMLPTLELMIAETGVIFGLLYAKAADGTVKNTFRVFQVSIVAVISIIAMQIALTYVTHAPNTSTPGT